MKILVVGAGGREHAIIRGLAQSPKVSALYAWPGNGGISADATCVGQSASDIPGVVDFALSQQIDLVVVAPDDPLVAGMVDAVEAAGVKAFGPRANAAIIEGSKVFSKDLMKRYHIPTAAYEAFDNPAAALAYLETLTTYPAVIKADGLALGKGVIIAADYPAAVQAVREIMEDKAFGASGNRIVIEEFLTGVEVSVLAFTDGKTLAPMVSSMDHKRVFDGDQGPNTGGMGTIAPNPHYTPAMAKVCMEEIFLPTIRAMEAEGRVFKGCLYFGLMLTPKGPTVIEYNCRFGDPETQVILPLLESDLTDILLATVDGTLGELDIRWREGAAACVILASGGYPGSYRKGLPIAGLGADGQAEGVTVYHAGTRREGDAFLTAGGRVLGVTATGETLPQALEAAYRAIDGGITFEGAHCRRDIGQAALGRS